jgi:hypothetical protein
VTDDEVKRVEVMEMTPERVARMKQAAGQIVALFKGYSVGEIFAVLSVVKQSFEERFKVSYHGIVGLGPKETAEKKDGHDA